MATGTTHRPPGTGESGDVARERRRVGARITARGAATATVLAALVGVGAWSLIDLRINVATLIDGYAGAVGFMERVWPLRVPEPALIAEQVGITLAVVLLATLLSVLLSLPLAVAAAAGTARGRVVTMRDGRIVRSGAPEDLLAAQSA